MIFTPIIITGSMHVRKKFIIDEDVMEALLLSFLFALNLLIFKFYRQKTSKQEELINKIEHDKKTTDEKLFDSLRYIGKVNVQIEEIKSMFNTTNAYPETKNDFKKSARMLSERILGIVNTNWALCRIINIDTHRTIYECFETRQGFSCRYPHVSNKMIVEKQLVSPFTTVILNPLNLNVLICCVMPVESINTDQHVFIQAIMNEITKLFIISNSSPYKDQRRLFAESRPDNKQ